MSERCRIVRINPLTAALGFVSVTRSSKEVRSFVVEAIGDSSISGSSWTQKCEREMEVSKNNPLTAALEFVSATGSSTVVHFFVVEMVVGSFSGRS